jgi:hypothetical protein
LIRVIIINSHFPRDPPGFLRLPLEKCRVVGEVASPTLLVLSARVNLELPTVLRAALPGPKHRLRSGEICPGALKARGGR